MIVPGKLDTNIKRKGKIIRLISSPIYGSIKSRSSNNLTPLTWTKRTDNQLLFVKASRRNISEKEIREEMKKNRPRHMLYIVAFFCLLLIPVFLILILFVIWRWNYNNDLSGAIWKTSIFFVLFFWSLVSVIHMNCEETRFGAKTEPEYYILNNYNKTKFEQTLDYMVNKYWWFWYYYEKTYLYWRVMHSELIINTLRTKINDRSELSNKLFAAVCRLALFIRLTKQEVKFLKDLCINNTHDKIIKPITYEELAKIMDERFKSEQVNKDFAWMLAPI